MNTIFNFSTFFKLVKTDLYASRKTYLVIFITFISYFAFHIWQIEAGLTHGSAAISLLSPLGWLIICIAPFLFYNRLYDKVQGVDYMMLPANAAEKFAAAIVQTAICIPLFTIIITLGFDYIISWIYKFELSNLFANLGVEYLDSIAIQSLALWACFWFKKNKIRNLLLTLCIFSIGSFFVSTLSLAIYMRIFTDLIQTNTLDYFLLYFSDLSHWYIFLIFPLFLWGLSFYKFTRQQL